MDLQNTLYDTELVVGTLLPLLIAIIVQSYWSARVQSIATLAICAVTAFVLHWQEWSAAPPVESFITIVLTTVAWYKGVWKPTGLAPVIENETTFVIER